ncbi:hypothetical protein [Nonomuraea bangladeshensis]|uniref:hypothetical protein n=1 Tax=Nonomuraea bangladeshensis TaxID=404385 RepID=UPI0031D2E11B
MTAWIWLYERGSNPYTTDRSYRFEVRTVAHAREMAAALYPAAPELVALVVIDCEYTSCGRRLLFSEEQADSIERGRELAFHPTAFFGGWYRGLYRGRLADICQWHYEVDPETNLSQKVGTTAAARKAAEMAPIGGDQLDLFGAAP